MSGPSLAIQFREFCEQHWDLHSFMEQAHLRRRQGARSSMMYAIMTQLNHADGITDHPDEYRAGVEDVAWLYVAWLEHKK
jgi:hypothetical protein